MTLLTRQRVLAHHSKVTEHEGPGKLQAGADSSNGELWHPLPAVCHRDAITYAPTTSGELHRFREVGTVAQLEPRGHTCNYRAFMGGSKVRAPGHALCHISVRQRALRLMLSGGPEEATVT